MTYTEIKDTGEIAKWNHALAAILVAGSLSNQTKPTSTIANPDIVYRLPRGLWWSHGVYPLGQPTRYVNLFGLGPPGPIADIEINFPIGSFRRTVQGAFVRESGENNSVLLCHRGRVQIKRQSPSVVIEMKRLGATFIGVSGIAPLIRVCSVTSFQLNDIIDFVDKIVQAKARL